MQVGPALSVRSLWPALPFGKAAANAVESKPDDQRQDENRYPRGETNIEEPLLPKRNKQILPFRTIFVPLQGRHIDRLIASADSRRKRLALGRVVRLGRNPDLRTALRAAHDFAGQAAFGPQRLMAFLAGDGDGHRCLRNKIGDRVQSSAQSELTVATL
jgi:hypothetical protein